METVKIKMQTLEQRLEEAKNVLKASKQMVQQMQDTVFCMEVDVARLKEKIRRSEVHQ